MKQLNFQLRFILYFWLAAVLYVYVYINYLDEYFNSSGIEYKKRVTNATYRNFIDSRIYYYYDLRKNIVYFKVVGDTNTYEVNEVLKSKKESRYPGDYIYQGQWIKKEKCSPYMYLYTKEDTILMKLDVGHYGAPKACQ